MAKYNTAAWMAHIRGMRKGARKHKHKTRSVLMARGRRAQSRRISRAINWFKGGMVAKGMIPALLAGVLIGTVAPRFTGSQVVKLGAAGIAGGVPAVAGAFFAPTITGMLGMNGAGAGSSSAYYG